jgi:uncharacterized protein YggE
VPTEPRVIVVNGEGEAVGVPDRCLVSLALTALRDSAADAVASVADLADRVITTIREAGVEASDVRTQNVTVQDWYDQQQQRVTARVATYALIVKNRALDQVSDLLSGIAAVAGDALRVQGIVLTVSDLAPLRAAARRGAVNDATVKATQLADASGVRIGRVLAIEEGVVPGRGFSAEQGMVRHAAVAASAPLPIEPGNQAVTVRVTMTFEIEP